MTELINISKLYLYEEHIPLELRVNFVCNTLLWYWLKPMEIHDYCYNTIIKLVDECLHKGYLSTIIINYEYINIY